MSFGDLKVQDLIYEDSSNNEVTVVIADLATKANPTFTGTVTVPTAPASDVSTKAASTAFVDAYYASKAAPAFTGSATGVNLTLSGNLVVNGTTTTIDSVTLSVKDKNIELGVVSSPSDTTADGGGITLKGASDKTFNWVNATDAWTSSEHIYLGDNKKLLLGVGSGGEQDLSIYSNGSEGVLETQSGGTIQFKCNTGSSSTNTFATFSGAASQLDFYKSVFFQGNSKNIVWDKPNDSFYFTDNAKIRLGAGSGVAGDLLIYSDGTQGVFDGDVQFLGAAQNIEWEKSANSLTFKSPSAGAASGKAHWGSGGSSYQNLEIWMHTSTAIIQTSHSPLQIATGNSQDLNLLSSKDINFINSTGTTNYYMRCKENSGSDQCVELYYGNTPDKKLETTATGVNVVGALTINGSALSAAPEITGTTDGAVTAGDAITVTTDGELQKIVSFTKAAGTPGEANNTYAGNIQVAYDKISGKVAAAFRESSSISVKIGTISGTTVSWGTKQTMVSGSTDPFAIGFHNNVLVFGYRASAAKVKAATVSGTVATFGSAADFGGGNNSYFESAFYSEGKARWVLLWRDAGDYPTYTKLVVGSVSGTTFSGGSVINVFTENSGAVGRVDRISMKEMPSVNKFVVCGVKDAGNENFILRVGEINASNNSVTWENDQRPIFFNTGNEFDYYGTKYAVSIGWNDTDKYAVATGRRGQGSLQQRIYSLKLNYNETTKDFSWDTSSVLKVDDEVTSNWNDTIYIPELNQLMVIWVDQATSDGQGYFRWKTVRSSGTNTLEIVDPSGGVSTLGNALGANNRCHGSGNTYLNAIYTSSSRVLIGYRDISQSNKTYTVMQQLAGSNLAAQEFIGFASSSVGDNATLTVKVTGNTVTKSGLSAGKKHYLQSDGTLSTSPDSPSVEVGIALTSSSLLIKG